MVLSHLFAGTKVKKICLRQTFLDERSPRASREWLSRQKPFEMSHISFFQALLPRSLENKFWTFLGRPMSWTETDEELQYKLFGNISPTRASTNSLIIRHSGYCISMVSFLRNPAIKYNLVVACVRSFGSAAYKGTQYTPLERPGFQRKRFSRPIVEF